MFEKKTVFIIGAGASSHFDYPTNAELLELVMNEAINLVQFQSRQLATFPMPKIVERLKDQADQNPNKAWQLFYRECNELATRINLNRPVIIDHFLRDNPDLRILGKTLIAKVIGQHETSCFRNTSSKVFKENWVSLVANEMTNKCLNPMDIKQNKVHFITFNYDLSLERLLIANLKSRTRFREIDFEYLISEERFIHMYGAISENPLLPPTEQFTPTNTNTQFAICEVLDAAYLASSSMHLIDLDEKDKNETHIERAKKIIKESDNVFILGYSFDPSNNERLGFPETIQNNLDGSHYRQIYFTAFGEDKIAVSRRAGREIFKSDGVFFDKINFNWQYGSGRTYAEKSDKKVFHALAHDFLMI